MINKLSKIRCYLTHPDEDLPKLNDLERKIIEMRFGIGEFNRPHTLREISEYFSSTTTHVWARERMKKILKKVRYKSLDEDC